jgi:hypothetical protein
LLVLAVGVGAFFVGRATVTTGPGTTNQPGAKTSLSKFNALSVSFDSLDQGWVLGTAPCTGGRSCLTLLETSNRGHTWSKRGLPASLLHNAERKLGGTTAAVYGAASLNVRFANRDDGWIYGTLPGRIPKSGVDFLSYGPTLWSTHDGGATWREQHLSWAAHQPAIFDLEASSRTVYLEFLNPANQVSLASSPVGDDKWGVIPTPTLYLPAGGAQPTGAIVLSGSSGWMVAGNDRGVSASLQLTPSGTWLPWTPPCESVGNSYVVPAASSPSDLVVVCVMGGFASPLSSTAPSGATIGSGWLYFSANGGGTFRAGPELSPKNFFFDGVLASPAPNTVLVSGPGGANDLSASSNGGRTWNVVYKGAPFFMGFTSSRQGVALVQTHAGRNSMIMTVDGGRNWQKVQF